MKNTKFVVKVNRGVTRALEYVQPVAAADSRENAKRHFQQATKNAVGSSV